MNLTTIIITAIAIYLLLLLMQTVSVTLLLEKLTQKYPNLDERGFLEPLDDDICIWADGTWCYRHELSGMQFMSDDITILTVGSEAYDRFLDQV